MSEPTHAAPSAPGAAAPATGSEPAVPAADSLVSLSPTQLPGAVTEQLRDYFDSRASEVADIDPLFAEVVDSLRSFVLDGGKRVRPSFAWQGWLGAAGHLGTWAPAEDSAQVLSAVSALELVQACALVHDDIIDNADTRRGNPTIHKIYEDKHAQEGWRGDAARFGNSTAIIAGDLALSWSDDMFHAAGLSTAALRRALIPWRAMRTEVLGGQLLDITAEASGDSRIEIAHKVNLYKTAAYTIERPLHIGAAIAGAPAEVVAAYRSFGRDIGVAFQLRDDQLGVFGDPDVTGKPAGDDLREGKRTVLVARALAAYRTTAPEKADFIQDRLGRVRSSSEIAQLRDLIAESGASEEVERDIERLTQRAFATLEQVELAGDTRENLIAMGIAATARQK